MINFPLQSHNMYSAFTSLNVSKLWQTRLVINRLLERYLYLFLPHPVFLLLMLIPLSNFSLTSQSRSLYYQQPQKDFEAQQNPDTRKYVIDFVLLYPGNTQVILLLQFFITILSIISWPLVPLICLLHPLFFCQQLLFIW